MNITLDYAWDPWIISSSCLWTEILRPVYRFESLLCIVSAIYVEVTVLPLLVDGNIITVGLLPRVIYSNPLFMQYPPTDWEAAKRREPKRKTEGLTLKQSNYTANLYTVYIYTHTHTHTHTRIARPSYQNSIIVWNCNFYNVNFAIILRKTNLWNYAW
jgi:hypothetical protein